MTAAVESERYVFPLIADPESYRAASMDLLNDPPRLRVWLDIFRHQLKGLRGYAIDSVGDSPDARRRADVLVEEFGSMLDTIAHDPGAFGEPTVLRFCELRERVLRACGFDDAYLHVKAQENERALALLPKLIEGLDALDDPARRLRVHVEHVFAGNIFDMGAAQTTALFEGDGIDFHAVRGRLPERPWAVDDLDALTNRMAAHTHERAVLFVDNAGADVVLGMIPLARYLLERGTEVVLTANTTPALNDITHDELGPLIDRIGAFDPVIADARADGRLTLVPSGNGIPLIDLSDVSRELAEAAADADLLVLEGMGRALESNWFVRFRCDTLKLAMIKEPDVAALVGGGAKMYDVVCRYEAAGRA